MATATAAHYATVNPYTGEVLAEFGALEGAAVDGVVEASWIAFEAWRKVPIEERARAVARAGDLLAERGERFARLVTLEMGKLIGESRQEVDVAAEILRWYGEFGPEIADDEPLVSEGGEAVIVNEPLGVLFAVEPWNFPLYQVARVAGPNLTLGNTILLKHAGNCPQTALALEELFQDAGVPPDVYTNAFVELEDVPRVIGNPAVRGVALTGSDRGGSSLAEQAGRNVKKSLLELGGSDPFLVLDGKHLERTVDAAAKGRLGNAGQSCVASKRFIVLDGCYEEFVSGLRDRFVGLQLGDPMDPATELGPLASEKAAEKLMDQVEDAVEKGATIVCGGGRPVRPGAFFEPTILTGVTPAMRAYREELFGPVAVAYRAAGEDEAVALANDTPYGLGGSVFAHDLERARRVAERIESGMVFVNRPALSRPELPFGGVKRSGYGRELSDLGMQEFVNKKLIFTVPPSAPVGGFTG